MTRAEIDAKLQACEQWARWMPVQPRSVLALAMHDEGYVGAIEVRGVGRQKYQALVIAASDDCRWVKPSDVVVFDLGKGEQLTTLHGEVLWWTNEENCDGVDDDFFKPPVQTAAGLWVPA